MVINPDSRKAGCHMINPILHLCFLVVIKRTPQLPTKPIVCYGPFLLKTGSKCHFLAKTL